MSVERGRTAETLATTFLEQQGYTIVENNWRNRWCEVDIVARSPAGIHFIEVKYRRRVEYGHPAEYISHDKANRLRRAALAWNQAHQYAGPYQIDVIGVAGALDQPQIELIASAVTDW